MRQIGREGSFTPYWFHGLQQAFVRLAPEWIIRRQVRGVRGARRAPHLVFRSVPQAVLPCCA